MNINYAYLGFLLLLLFSNCKEKTHKEAGLDWPVYLGGNNSLQYSSLDQINKENIDKLKVAWRFSTNDADSDGRTQIQCNPIIIDGILYGSSPKLKIFALDAATGKEKWIYDPNANIDFAMNVNRGVSYWKDGSTSSILFTVGPELICLNAVTGKPRDDFGENGKVSLEEGFDEEAKKLYVVSTSPGIIYKDKIIIGTRVSENNDAAPGHIRAFNVRTGTLEWIFHTIPKPGERGYETWPKDAYKYIGGANAWAGMALDETRGIVYAPTGSASYDFYGGNRIGENLFANCLLALDAETGQYIWHFQTVHHDLWDRDVPAPPTLVTVNHNGKSIDAAAQVTKSGHVFLLDRDTGKPLFSVEERPVPPSDLLGERASKTQPFPVEPPPFTRQKFTKEEITNISKESHDYVVERLAKLRTGQQFIPPSTEGSIVFPGFDGGAGWGGAAYDPASGLLYINAKEIPCIITMERTDIKEQAKLDLGQSAYQMNCVMCHGKERQGDPSAGYPSLSHLANKYKKSEVMQIIENGKGGLMPGFGHLDVDSKNALVNFLFEIKNEPISPHEIGLETNRDILPYIHTGYNRFYDQNGYPAVKPPWGTLTAIDLNRGTIKWQVLLGEYQELTSKGVPKTGTANYGGPVVTAGGMIFIAATIDEYFRAFDAHTGKEVWKFKLPAAGYATPSIYKIDGKEYIVIACGGGKANTKSGDSYLAFAL